MQLEEILSFLENEEKRNRLIYKLKHAGEDSKQIHAFKEIINSFNLNKTPKGIYQTTLLQNTFQFCEPKESFLNLRLVCKSWKHAVETIRYNWALDLEKLSDFAQNGEIPIYYAKYIKIFKKIEIWIDSEFLTNYDKIITYILNHVKKINDIWLGSDVCLADTHNFESFLLQLLQNSQTTLTGLWFPGIKIFDIPIISLPNITQIVVEMFANYNDQISNFDRFVKNMVRNCEYLEKFTILNIHKCPNIVEYIKQNYQKHCISTGYIPSAKILPVKISFCHHLSLLQEFEYPSTIEFLRVIVDVSNLSSPFENGWKNYQTNLALCPRLKDMTISCLSEEGEIVDLQNALHDVSQENRDIWEERLSYLKSRGVKVSYLKKELFDSKFKEFCKQNKWGFQFGLR